MRQSGSLSRCRTERVILTFRSTNSISSVVDNCRISRVKTQPPSEEVILKTLISSAILMYERYFQLWKCEKFYPLLCDG
jgi:hypothetical protein